MKRLLVLCLVILLVLSAACSPEAIEDIGKGLEDRFSDLFNDGNGSNGGNKNDDSPGGTGKELPPRDGFDPGNRPTKDGNDGNENNPGESPNDGSSSGTQSTNERSLDEARRIAQAWLRDNSVNPPDILDREYTEENYNGQDYYRFFLNVPQMYWFNILVPKEPGDLIMMLIEDGMDGGVYFYPLDEWYENAYLGHGGLAIHLLWNAITDAETQGIVMSLHIFWDNGTQTIFYNEYFDGWRMISRTTGDDSEVVPEYTLKNDSVEIRFPTTTRVYYLYDDHTGVFGSESFKWDFRVY